MESLAMIAVMLDGPMTATKIPAPMALGTILVNFPYFIQVLTLSPFCIRVNS